MQTELYISVAQSSFRDVIIICFAPFSQVCWHFDRAHLDYGTKFGMMSLLGVINNFGRVAT